MPTKAPVFNVHHESPDIANWIIISIVLLAVIGTALMAWSTLQPVAASPTTVRIAQPNATAEPASAGQNLKLNNPHQHQGPIIQVDPAKIGKDNPFTKSQ